MFYVTKIYKNNTTCGTPLTMLDKYVIIYACLLWIGVCVISSFRSPERNIKKYG